MSSWQDYYLPNPWERKHQNQQNGTTTHCIHEEHMDPFFFFFLKLLFNISFMVCVVGWAPCGRVWRTEDSHGSQLSLHHVNSRDQTQAIRLANEDLWVNRAIVLVRVFQLNKLESCGKREFLHWGITSMILAYGCVCGAVTWKFSQLWVVLHQLWRWSLSVTFPHGFCLSFYFRSPAWVSPSTSDLDGL